MGDFKKELVEFIRQLYQSNDYIPLHRPYFGGNEKRYLEDTIDSTFVSSIGEYVDRFELEITNFTGSRYAIATTNGTSALHTALFLSDVSRDDEVLTQSLTFVATCNAISYCNAIPIFIDIDKNTLGMCPENLNKFLEHYAEKRGTECWNKKTKRRIKACIPMHNFGHPVEIDKIVDICKEYNIKVIEDAAESLGSFFRERHTGIFGDFGILSFNGNKIITSGGGGMILTNDESLAIKAKHITTTAKKPHPWLFMHDQNGYNYRLPNINAALGCAQMEQLSEFIKKKRIISSGYAEWFSELEYKFIDEPANCKSNFWFNAFLCNTREERDHILEYTNENGVMTRPAWTPMHHLPMYSDSLKMDLRNTEFIEDRLINIPSSVI